MPPSRPRGETIDLISSSSSSSDDEQLRAAPPRRPLPQLTTCVGTSGPGVSTPPTSSSSRPTSYHAGNDQRRKPTPDDINASSDASRLEEGVSASSEDDEGPDEDGTDEDQMVGAAGSKDLVLTLSSRKGTTVVKGTDLANALRADTHLWQRILLLEPIKLTTFVEFTQHALASQGVEVGRGLTGKDRVALRAWLEARGVCVWTDD